MTAIAASARLRYISQNVGSLNCTIVSAGMVLSSIPQRRICRQSTRSAVGVISGRRSEAGGASLKIALIDLAASSPISLELGIRPPTTPVPMNVSKGP